MLPEREARRMLASFLGGLDFITTAAEEGFPPAGGVSLPRLTWSLTREGDTGDVTLRVWCADHAGCVAALERLHGAIPYPGVLLRGEGGCLALVPRTTRVEAELSQPCRAEMTAEVRFYER